MEQLNEILTGLGIRLAEKPNAWQVKNIIELIDGDIDTTLVTICKEKNGSYVLTEYIPLLIKQFEAREQACELLGPVQEPEPVVVELLDDYGLWVGHSILSREKGPSVLELTPWEYIQEAKENNNVEISEGQAHGFLSEFYKPDSVAIYLVQLGY